MNSSFRNYLIINYFRNLFDEQRVPNLAGDTSVMHDIHCVSSVLKLYFRDLPTPLVTYDLYPHLVLASKQSEARRGDKYREILQRLPGAHYRYCGTCLHFNILTMIMNSQGGSRLQIYHFTK